MGTKLDGSRMLALRHAFDGLRAAWNAQAPTAELHDHFFRVDAALEALCTQPVSAPLVALAANPPGGNSAETPRGADNL